MTAVVKRPTETWVNWRPHPVQEAARHCDSRFIIVRSGRRSGKTHSFMEKMIEEAWTFPFRTGMSDGLFVFAGPTREHAKGLFWDRLLKLVPRAMIAGRPNIVELSIRLKNNVQLKVMGAHEPERFQGFAIDCILLDEYASMTPSVWEWNVRPALSTPGRPPGRAFFISRPKGQNHMYHLEQNAVNDSAWARFHWTSEEVMEPEEIAQAKRDLDPRSYSQEYLAEYIQFEGRAYYAYDVAVHRRPCRHLYDPRRPIWACFDFNTAPGVCAIRQDARVDWDGSMHDVRLTIGEVYIPTGSNTGLVCDKVIADWGEHQSDVMVDGDTTGGAARSSSEYMGGDWEWVKRKFSSSQCPFRTRVRYRVGRGNPQVIDRVNSANHGFRDAEGRVYHYVDPSCRHTDEDFQLVTWKEGADFVIEKDKNGLLTHCSDAVSYNEHNRFPLKTRAVSTQAVFG